MADADLKADLLACADLMVLTALPAPIDDADDMADADFIADDDCWVVALGEVMSSSSKPSRFLRWQEAARPRTGPLGHREGQS